MRLKANSLLAVLLVLSLIPALFAPYDTSPQPLVMALIGHIYNFLVSVNIWDARSEGNYVTSNIFLMYRDKGENKTIYGDFVIETDRDYNILTVYRK